ncbi:hypothetical protein HMPREF1016_01383 [Bacteroides eggerthii 1_2_48FAA]|uniref:Uncharacterized protein n=1 Tax=Bacteroides eggerthii 1_2_48FAA TaxID=665953 RepID=E5WXI1_9BACE|nr:hypothetical protein HMPREF1016_01383 [Bacteroides eggerthii 1_2_48FAA]
MFFVFELIEEVRLDSIIKERLHESQCFLLTKIFQKSDEYTYNVIVFQQPFM